MAAMSWRLRLLIVLLLPHPKRSLSVSSSSLSSGKCSSSRLCRLLERNVATTQRTMKRIMRKAPQSSKAFCHTGTALAESTAGVVVPVAIEESARYTHTHKKQRTRQRMRVTVSQKGMAHKALRRRPRTASQKRFVRIHERRETGIDLAFATDKAHQKSRQRERSHPFRRSLSSRTAPSCLVFVTSFITVRS